MSTSTEIREWYNAFTQKQRKTGTNLRHFSIFNAAVRLGLRKHHTILEIGCGIGTLTGLLNSYITKGKLVATDISDASVSMAKNWVKNANRVDFIVTDMADFSYSKKFDFVILPDVLEHIPIHQHPELFRTISQAINDNGHVLINIPHPRYIEHMQAHEPEKMQIVDQALSADDLIQTAYGAGFILESYTGYSIFNEGHDYAFIHFTKGHTPRFRPIPRATVIRRKTAARLKRIWAQIIH